MYGEGWDRSDNAVRCVANADVQYSLNTKMLDRREGALAKTFFYEGDAVGDLRVSRAP